MTDCEPCALREAGNMARAEAIEAIRTQRLVLSFLNGAEDAVGLIAAELGGCRDCIGRLAAGYLGMYATSLAHICGSVEGAVKATERVLLEDLDGQQS